MKLTLSTSLIPALLIILLGNPAFSQNLCNGRSCNSDQYCDRSSPDENNHVCVPKNGYGQGCKDNEQCNVSNGECAGEGDNKLCLCRDKFVESNGHCVLGCLGEGDNITCSSGSFCSVPLKGCLPQVELNQPCADGSGVGQCRTGNAECTSETCSCSTDFVEKDGNCIPSCPSTPCSFIQFCDQGLCKPKSYLYEPCQNKEQCLQENSECDTTTCKCVAGFIDYFGGCLPSCQANDCEADQFCDMEYSICANKAPLHQGCVVAEGNLQTCSDDNSECSGPVDGRKTCECKTDFVDRGDGVCSTVCSKDSCTTPGEFCNSVSGNCEPKLSLGQICSAPGEEECADDLAECDNGSPARCRCVAGHIEAAGKCVQPCTKNEDCTTGDLFCTTALGICNPKIGLNGYCDLADTEQCKTDKASCKGTVCSCDAGLAEDIDTSTCVTACGSDSDCSTDKYCDIDIGKSGSCFYKVDLAEQCSIVGSGRECKTSNSECQFRVPANETLGSICKCGDGFIQRDNTCVINCKSTSDCTGSNEYCEESSGFCQKKAQLNQQCSYKDQCSSSDAECKPSDLDGISRCTCKSTHAQWSSTCLAKCTANSCTDSEYCHGTEGLCYKKVGLHRGCTDKNQCSSPAAVCKKATSASVQTTCECDTGNIDKGTYCLQACSRQTVCNFDTEFCDSISLECGKKLSLNSKCSEEGFDQCLDHLTTCKGQNRTSLSCDCIPDAKQAAGSCICEDNFVESTQLIKCLKVSKEIVYILIYEIQSNSKL